MTQIAVYYYYLCIFGSRYGYINGVMAEVDENKGCTVWDEACIIMVIQSYTSWSCLVSSSNTSPFLFFTHSQMQTRSSSNEPSSPNVNNAEREQPNVLALTTAIKKCVDFVNELPWEIVKCHLIPRIFGEGRPIVRLDRPYPCLDVCSTWTKRIVSADDSIHFVLHVDHPLSKHHRMRLRMVAPFIKSLALQDLGVYNPELVKCGQFLSLTKLNIEGNYWG